MMMVVMVMMKLMLTITGEECVVRSSFDGDGHGSSDNVTSGESDDRLHVVLPLVQVVQVLSGLRFSWISAALRPSTFCETSTMDASWNVVTPGCEPE